MMWRPMPYGIPVRTELWPHPDSLFVAKVRIKLKLREGLRPWFQFHNGLDNMLEEWDHGTLVEETKVYHTLTLTSVDLDILDDWYEVQFEESYQPTFWVFRSKSGLLQPYIDYHTQIKENAAKGSKNYTDAKLMINSVYGRSGLNVTKDSITLEWSDDLHDFDWVATALDDDEENDAYIPYACFATAWARKKLLDHALLIMRTYGPDSLIHMDTDSVIYKGGTIEGVDYGDHLGTWGLESCPPVVIEAGFKRYMELKQYPIQSMNDLIGMACAGVPQKWDYDHRYPIGMWVELLDDPETLLIDGHVLGQEHYRIQSDWLRKLYQDNGADPDDVDTRKLIPVKVMGGWILEGRQHHLNDNLYWRLRR